MTDTGERALAAAVERFGEKGWDGVTMEEVASAVGIKAPSLYKYFSGKAALYEGCLDAARRHYDAVWQEAEDRQRRLADALRGTGSLLELEQLEAETMGWLNGELESAEAARLRRLLSAARARHGALAEACLWERPVAAYQTFFAQLIEGGILRRGDPAVMAVQYMAPLLRELERLDRLPERRTACREELRACIRQFHRVFAVRERPAQTPPGRLFRR